ncbi:hypothetical protein [[Clostridium] scindens]|uniref:hypothetical protein n=1 Tax=Clostridium scindens (strain JCM 10418 / VPI 12708) TaxID=29347 RepID=UPI0039A14C09
MMEIITGYTGKAHIFSEQDRDVNIGIVGEGSYVLQTGMQLEAEVSSNNEIKIRDGVLMHQGCTASIKKNTYDSLTIINGSQGMKRIDLIVARYERNQDNGTESISLKVIQGTPEESNPAVPSHITGDIQSGDAVADMPMYKIIIDGLNITEVQKVYSEAPNITELNRKLNVSAADIISFTPLAGQNYPNWGGCYYYTSGSRVHVHLGIQALPANKVATVFVLPESVHPKTRILNIGPSGSFPGVARIEISLDGGINVTSQDTYAAADIEYDTYS